MIEYEQSAGLAFDESPFVTKAGRLAGIALGLGGALTFAVFARLVYVALAGQRRFNTWPTIFVYYVLPAAVTALLFASLRFKPISRMRLAMIVVSLTTTLYAVEGVLALTNRAQLKPLMTTMATSSDKEQYAAELTRLFGVRVDPRPYKEAIDDLRRSDPNAVPVLTPSNHLFVPQPDGSIQSAIRLDGREVMPLAGVSGRLTLLCNEGGQWIAYQSDSRGFNNPPEVWGLRQLDVAALGDSFAQGYCVARDRNFVDRIRQRHPATLNLGIAGDGPLLMLATLKEYLPRLAPKIVLWFYFEENDLTDLQTERRSALLGGYLTSDFLQPALGRQHEIDSAMIALVPGLEAKGQRDLNEHRRNSILYSLIAFAKLTSIRERLGVIDGTETEVIASAADFATKNPEVFREILQQAKTRVESWNGQLYFVYLPGWTRYAHYNSAGVSKRDDVLNLARSLGLPVIDLDPVFQAHGNPLSLFPFHSSGHYNEIGHQLVAEEVLRQLASSGRLNPQ